MRGSDCKTPLTKHVIPKFCSPGPGLERSPKFIFSTSFIHDCYEVRSAVTCCVTLGDPVDRKDGLPITDYGLMSCDTAGHHVTLLLLGWL